MRALHPAVPLLLAGSLLLSGCGGEEESSADSAASTAAAQSSSAPGTDAGALAGDDGELSPSECRALAQFPPEVAVPQELQAKPEVTVPEAPVEELQTTDLVTGEGQPVQAGDCVVVNYVGVGQSSGEEFDASFDRGQPFVFPLGAGAVIEGWDEGVEGATVGTRREIVIPGELAYGEGPPPGIQPNETLVFVVDVLGVAQADGSVVQE